MAPGSVNLVLILDGNCRSSCRTVGQDLLESVDQKVLTPLFFCFFKWIILMIVDQYYSTQTNHCHSGTFVFQSAQFKDIYFLDLLGCAKKRGGG